MVAIDTNILVRLIVRDDQTQLQQSRALVSERPVFVSLICLLETIWVLQSRFGWKRPDIDGAIRMALDVQHIFVELEAHAYWALDRWAAGADIADMLLLVASRDCASFATFDKRLPRQAGSASPVPIEILT